MENFIKVKVGKIEHGFKFTMPTLELICRREGLKYQQLGEFIEKQTIRSLLVIFLCANAVYNNGVEKTEIEIGDIIDSMTGEQLTDVIDLWNESLTHILDKLKSMVDASAKKKKSHG